MIQASTLIFLLFFFFLKTFKQRNTKTVKQRTPPMAWIPIRTDKGHLSEDRGKNVKKQTTNKQIKTAIFFLESRPEFFILHPLFLLGYKLFYHQSLSLSIFSFAFFFEQILNIREYALYFLVKLSVHSYIESFAVFDALISRYDSINEGELVLPSE